MCEIKDRAYAWINSGEAGTHPYNRLAMLDAYIAGAHAERVIMSTWNSPSCFPSDGSRVLTKWRYKSSGDVIISVGSYDGESWDADSILYPDLFEFLGWREILE
jgi:hypothetical protein